VGYPASDLYVTAVGGTTISNVSGSSFTEYTWNDDGVLRHVTGGGISEVFRPPNFPLPPWQSFVRVPGFRSTTVATGAVFRMLPEMLTVTADTSSISLAPHFPTLREAPAHQLRSMRHLSHY
jgi:hypothetical protein